MNQLVKIGGSILAIAGLIQEGINAKNTDPYSLSLQSIVIVILCGIFLFILNVKKFYPLCKNLGSFNFDDHNQQYSFFIPNERSRKIFKCVPASSVIEPPK